MGVISLPHVPHLPPLPRLPGVPYVPPMWRESRVGLEARALRHSAIWRGEGVAAGDGRPVLLIPGFLAGDGSLATMTQWLRANGYHTRRAGIRANISCSEIACARLEARLEGFAQAQGRPVTIIGQSRGGIFARALAARRPDLVEGIVTLGSPTVSQLRVHPLVLLQIGLVGALGTGHVPGLFSLRCLRGHCCSRFREALEGPLPADVHWVALYSRSDGIVDWRACCAPEASELVEVRSTHCGMGLNAGVYEEVARALAITRPLPAGAPRETALAA
jgi:triacylglycerol lipase